MSRSTHRRNHLLALAAGLGTLLPATAAYADSAAFLKLQYGVGGPVSDGGHALKDAGPGTEQSTVTYLTKNGKTYIVTIWMSSMVSESDRNWQCKCNSVEVGPMGPGVVVDSRQLTHGHSERPCNHPIATSDGKHVVWVYGSDTNTSQHNVATYAGVVDEMCQSVVDPVRVSDDDNKNEGAPDIAYNGNGQFTSGYLSGGQTTYAIGLKLSDDGTNVSLHRNYKTAVVNPANIGRPAIVAASATRSLLCAAKGDNRPPEDGVECAWLDATSGSIMWKDIIAASNPGNHVYMNQPSVALLDYGRIAINVQQSDGNGKNTNQMGTDLSHLYVIEPNDQSYEMKDTKMGMSPIGYDKHAAICSGSYGESGETRIAVMGASPTGVGLPGVQFASYSTDTGLVADKSLDFWQVAPYGDSGYLSNIYGENPHDQGRDFLRCVGNFRNPGYGVKGGFLENAETLIIMGVSGRVPGEPKNALFLSFIPGKVKAKSMAPPGQPLDVTNGWTPPSSGSGNPTGGTNPTGGMGGGSSTGGGEGGNGDSPTGGFKTDQANGCSVSTPGSSSQSSGFAALAALGLGILVSRRRREEG
ncbi:MAG TPA: MYXO-CTERM sorting domain-containing protein [Minicystis sp.]|nr:MYXO-CTERM sorting domain-containing protein [Minicystis sp.]